MQIGFFDSGIGGLTVLYDSLRLLKNLSYLYYADTENVPYGTKDKDLVKEYIFEAVDFIVQQGVDGLVVACNTATSIAIRELRAKYRIPIIGMEPAVKPAVEKCKDKRVLVLATPLTLQEDKYEDLVSRIDHDHIVDSLPLPELVEFAERYQFQDRIIEPYLREKLTGYMLEDYGTVVLGCTHFIYFKKILQRLFPEDIQVIDGNIGTIKHLANLMDLPICEDEEINPVDLIEKNITLFLSGKRGDIDIIKKYFVLLQ